jgi:hypothetical protein
MFLPNQDILVKYIDDFVNHNLDKDAEKMVDVDWNVRAKYMTIKAGKESGGYFLSYDIDFESEEIPNGQKRSDRTEYLFPRILKIILDQRVMSRIVSNSSHGFMYMSNPYSSVSLPFGKSKPDSRQMYGDDTTSFLAISENSIVWCSIASRDAGYEKKEVTERGVDSYRMMRVGMKIVILPKNFTEFVYITTSIKQKMHSRMYSVIWNAYGDDNGIPKGETVDTSIIFERAYNMLFPSIKPVQHVASLGNGQETTLNGCYLPTFCLSCGGVFVP